MAEHSDRKPADDAVVEAAARANALDRYLTARLAPRAVRGDLIALAAFMGDTARIVATASEPLIGEMRLQWWRDALAPEHSGEPTGNPIAEALRAAIARHGLPVDAFAQLLEARSRALDADFLGTAGVLDTYLDETEGTAFRLAARILDAGSPDTELSHAAGQAYGRIQLLRDAPLMLAARAHVASGMVVNDWAARAPAILKDARSWLQAARRRLASGGDTGRVAAVLPVALVEPYLAALENLGPNIVRERADISPLARVWRLWWASVRGKI